MNLVDWFNQVGLTYRSDLRELKELNFARVDAKLEQGMAKFHAKLQRFRAEFDTKLERLGAHIKMDARFRVGRVAMTFLARALD